MFSDALDGVCSHPFTGIPVVNLWSVLHWCGGAGKASRSQSPIGGRP
jgi:hypothetical protein